MWVVRRRRLRRAAVLCGAVCALGVIAPATSSAGDSYKISGLALTTPPPDSNVLATWGYGGTISSWVDSLYLRATVTGPAGGTDVGRLAVKITKIDCPAMCHTDRISLRPGLIPPVGSVTMEGRTDIWGCGHPKVSAKLLLRSGQIADRVKWKPKTRCGG